MRGSKFKTKALHAGYKPGGNDFSRAVPLYQSVAHLFRDTKHAADLFLGREEGFIYSRINNPTVDVFEKRMAELEGAEAGLGTSSGMAAIFMVSAHLASRGEEVVSSDRVYGGTFHLFNDTLPRFGIKVRFVKNPHDIKSWQSAITKKTKFLFVETPSNPQMEVFDIALLSELAHKYKLPLVVDSTIATPALQQPIRLGADIVAHSATKYICGNGTALGGIILGKKKLMDEIRQGVYRDIGPSLAPFNAWLFILGLETLSYRMEAHSQNALRVAEFLEAHPKIKRVYYPGLDSSPFKKLVDKEMRGRASSLMAFEVKGTRKNGTRFIESLKLVSHVANLGDNKTLAIHPASTTHQQLPAKDLKKVGISDTMIRMSIGLEDPEDIIYDIKQALNKI
ncbi:MAG: aminotransferase class I/II-fold pyridoxal phosphate-dependent enzyme [Candidatus Spechtbacterales bacterium]